MRPRVHQPTRLRHQEPAAVAQARAARRLSQRALAKKVGVTQQAIYAIEVGRVDADPTVLARIAEALNCPVELLERKRPFTCANCGYGYDAQPNGLIPVHTVRGGTDWCTLSGEPARQPEASAA